ncbi:uncharacterized protein LOC130713406 [Lotus japonicus]|uniref:uncharacterized protein LOC130713406 n=1 Tax=Lotus japonicus TaxID=34305 RepID=UPI002586453C|nr:uncharacterized protein LOC130713406 [Lotus japonicus]
MTEDHKARSEECRRRDAQRDKRRARSRSAESKLRRRGRKGDQQERPATLLEAKEPSAPHRERARIPGLGRGERKDNEGSGRRAQGRRNGHPRELGQKCLSMAGAEKKKSKAVGGGSKPKMSKDAPKRKKIDREKWPHLEGERVHLDDWCREILGIESCYANEDEGHFRRQYYLSEKQIGPGHDVFAPGGMADIDRTLLDALRVEDGQSTDEEAEQETDAAQGEEGHAENQPQPDLEDGGGAVVGGTSDPVQGKGRSGSEEEDTRGPASKKRRVDDPQDHADGEVQGSEPERAVPVTVIDELVLTESDQKYLGDREPAGLLNYVLRASLKTTSAVRYLQLSTLPELEELREKTDKDDQLISSMNKELEEGCSAIEELNKLLDNLKLENEQLKKKVQDGDAVREDLEGRLKSAEGKAETGATRLKEVEAALLKEREQSSAVKKEFEARIASLEADKKKLTATVSKINKASFNNAVSQLTVVNPGLETGPVRYRKVVSEGRIGTVDSNGKFTPTFPEENAP